MVTGTLTSLLSHSRWYRLWQAPFVKIKMRPFFENNDISKPCKVLDVACGPGTNTASFAGSFYLGIDMEQNYLEYARHTFGRDYVVADLGSPLPLASQTFDLILLNSVLHHLSPVVAAGLLRNLALLLNETGKIHIIDMVLPPRSGMARTLARLDRGRFVRTFEELDQIFGSCFEPILTETFEIAPFGLTLWKMVYFKGVRK